ncbi:NmrA family protein [Sphingobacteriaceae bacterium]|nr:NmrA family protein [Sphingobacteriaceae bacterium]
MEKIIVVAGATGNIGTKIVDALLANAPLGLEIRALVRKTSDTLKISSLEQKGIKVFQINMHDKNEIAKACLGASCVVSVLAGLEDTVIKAQKVLLDGALLAGVPRFIPSDFSTDFTRLSPGKNRNLDLRREFHTYLDKAPIKATTIFNGAFMDLLTTDMPLILFKKKRILSWGNSTIKMDFTTTLNVAEYTAKVALDDETPRYLRIAGDSASTEDVRKIMTELSTSPYKLFRPGGISLLNAIIHIAKLFDRSKTELYPAWQGMQYMRDMMEGKAVLNHHDNLRYTMRWTGIKDYLILQGVEKSPISLSSTHNAS